MRATKKITAVVLAMAMVIMSVVPAMGANIDVSTAYDPVQTIDGRTGWNTADGDTYLISEKAVTVHFVNHPFERANATAVNYWDNFVFETISSAAAKGITLRADAYGWTYGDTGQEPSYTVVTSWGADWDTFRTACDGNVSITAQKIDETQVTFLIEMGSTATETYTVTYPEGVPEDLRFHVGADGAYIEVTSVEYASGDEDDNGSEDGGYEAVTPQHVTVHDPSIIKDPATGTYYIFGSHLAWAKTDDLIHWTTFENNINTNYETLFAAEAEWCRKADSGYELWPDGSATNMWAPDVIWNDTMQKWCMYMSINGPKWNSTICLLTADSLEGNWTYVGPVIQSGMTNGYGVTFDYTKVTGETEVNSRYTDRIRNGNPTYEPHAIDPCVTYDEEGNLWMSYGSWSGGISMIRLDNETGLRDYNTTYEYVEGVTDPYTGYRLAGGNQASGEASYIEKIGDYYYLYVTYGGFAATGGYNMRIFRSKDITGPYLDYSGNDARYPLETGWPGSTGAGNTSGTVGNRLMSYYKWSYLDYGYCAQGHNSCFVDEDGKAYVIYHTRFNDGTEGHQVRVHQLFVNEDGWLVAAPFEYTGETLSSAVTAADVEGKYEVLFHRSDIDYANLEVVTGENLTFHADGTVTGDRTGTWSFSEAGAPNVTMTLGDTTYKGVFVEQQMEDSTDVTWAFTVLGDDEISVWGYKYVGSDLELAQKAAENLVMPEGTFINLTLPSAGINTATITWSSSNEAVLASDGTVTIPETDTKVTLTGTFTVGTDSVTKDYVITVYSPQTDSENKVLATYLTDEKLDLSEAAKGTYQFANPFYEGTTSGLEMYNGVSIKFDLEAAQGADQWLRDIISFNGGSQGGLFFEGNSYLGYNATGGFFDANVVNGEPWGWGTNFLGDSASVEIRILPVGFEVYVNGELAYDQDDVGSANIPGSTAGIDSYTSVLSYLRTGANYMNLGWGSWWEGGYYGTISNVEISVLPIEIIDTSEYLYYENFTTLAGTTGDATGWISANASQDVSVVSSTDEYGYYLNFAADAGANSRGIYKNFGLNGTVTENYTVEADVKLIMSSNQASNFAITGTDYAYSGNSVNNGIVSGYILKLEAAANSTTYTVNDDSNLTVTIPSGSWVHISATVDENGNVDADINGTKIRTTVNGNGILYGMYYLRGRYTGGMSIDNITVKPYVPEEEDTSGYAYYENYTSLTDTTGDATGWISHDAAADLSVKTDNDAYGNYLNFAAGTAAGNRGAYTLFGEAAQLSGQYTVEFDTALTAGVMSNRSESALAILGTDAADYNANSAVASGYILKLFNQPPADEAGNYNNYTLQDQWYVNDSDTAITIPVGTWVHISANVDTAAGTVTVTLTNRGTGEVLYAGTSEINGSGTLYGLQLLRGRGVGTASVDNITVKQGFEEITVGSMSGTAPAEMAWYDYSNFFGLKGTEDFTINWKFTNYNPSGSNWQNYAVAVTTDLERTLEASGDWYLRADNYSVSAFEGSTVTYANDWSWDDFISMLNGAEINAKLSRNGTTMTFTAVIEGSNGTTYHYTATAEDVPLDDVMVYLGGQDCYLEISEFSVTSAHNYREAVTAPTCTEDGYTTYTCIYDESHTYTGDEVSALGHVDEDQNGICDRCGARVGYVLALYSSTTEGVSSITNTDGGGVYKIGETASISAEAAEGFDFVGWYLGSVEGETVSYSGEAVITTLEGEYTIPEDTAEDIVLVAVFESKGKANVTITTVNGGQYTVGGSATVKEGSKEIVQVGTILTLTAVDSDKVDLWMNGNDKIIGTGASLSITVTGDMSIVLMYKGETAAQAFVEYVSDYGQLMSYNSYSAGDTIQVPAGPTKLGYNFISWDTTVEEIQQRISEGETHITVRPVYEATGKTYTVTVKYPEGALEDDVYADKAEGSGLTVTAKEIEGRYFAYWSSDAEGTTVLSYSPDYYICIGVDRTLYAIYQDQETEAVPTIAMTSVYASVVDGKNKVSFEATRSVPDTYTVLETGMLYTTRSEYETSPIEIGADGVGKYVFASNDNNGIITLNINVTGNEDITIYARGYMIIQNPDGSMETIYTETFEKASFNEL